MKAWLAPPELRRALSIFSKAQGHPSSASPRLSDHGRHKEHGEEGPVSWRTANRGSSLAPANCAARSQYSQNCAARSQNSVTFAIFSLDTTDRRAPSASLPEIFAARTVKLPARFGRLLVIGGIACIHGRTYTHQIQQPLARILAVRSETASDLLGALSGHR